MCVIENTTGWVDVHYEGKLLIVYETDGHLLKLPDPVVFYFNGKPERAYAGGSKFKHDEEPFMIVEPRGEDYA